MRVATEVHFADFIASAPRSLSEFVRCWESKGNMSEKTAAVDQAIKFSRKCPECGLRNFADTDRCRRCKSDLSLALTREKSNKQMRDKAGEFGKLKVSFVSIFAVALTVLLVLVSFHIRQELQTTPEAIIKAGVAQSATAEAEQPRQDPAEKDRQSKESANRILASLKPLQLVTQ